MPESSKPPLWEMRSDLNAVPSATSRGRPWEGVTVDRHTWPSGGQASSPPLEHDVIAMRISGNVRLTQTCGGRTHSSTASPGNITLDPRGMESRWSWDQPGEVAIVRVPTGLLADAAQATLRTPLAQTELENCYGRRDPFVQRVIALLLDELALPAHPGQTFITQALSSALACHMLHRYNAHDGRAAPLPSALHARAVLRVREFIEQNLHEPVSLDTLAAVANVSRFHFARVFRESTGVSAMVYLEQVRIARAQALIRTGRLPLAQIASQVGFVDQSYFTKRFRLATGMTPAAYARAVGVRGPLRQI